MIKDELKKVIDFVVNNSTLEEIELKNGDKITHRILSNKNFATLIDEIIRLNKQCKYWSGKYIKLKNKYEPDFKKEVF